MAARVAVLGAGAWGTAFAVHLAQRSRAAPEVTLWARSAEQARAIASARTNARYLPGVGLPSRLDITDDLACAARADIVVIATPMAAVADVAATAHRAGARAPLMWLAKGFVAAPEAPGGSVLAHHALATRWPAAVGVVSGPTFAEEVAQGLPTALAVASTDAALARAMADLLRGDTLRAYETDDIAGVETSGAVKNILAIAAGASDGLGFGHNARAALITRGLAETGRLSAALGGKRETLMGLAGLGDLVLTCTGDLSRNRRVGLALAQGKSLPAILAELGHVAEGVHAAKAARALAAHHDLDLPITEAVFQVLYEGLPARAAVEALLRREPRKEN